MSESSESSSMEYTSKSSYKYVGKVEKEEIKETSINLEEIKNVLKKIEEFVNIKLLSAKEKEQFIIEYRKFIIKNDKDIINCPNVSTFIYLFENEQTINIKLKDKIINALYMYKDQESNKNSKLKYW